MLPADRIAFASVLNGLAAVKPGAKLTPEALEIWWQAFQHWTIEQFRQAAAHLVRTCEFMPNPFHFEQFLKSNRPTSGEAWARVRELVRAGESTSGDALIDSAVRALGGYRALGMTHSDQMQFLERRFAEHYESIGEAERTREALPALMRSALSKLPYDQKRRLS